jgi:hypothetical protein
VLTPGAQPGHPLAAGAALDSITTGLETTGLKQVFNGTRQQTVRGM